MKVPIDGKVIGFFDRENNSLVCKRLGNSMLSEDNINALEKACKKKPNIIRGEEKGGVSDRFVSSGSRKNPKGKGVGTYAFKSGVSHEEMREINDGMHRFCTRLEDFAKDSLPSGDLEFIKAVNKKYKMPTASGNTEGFGTQCSIGLNYHARLHTDRDWFWTVLGVYCPDVDDSKILYYFCYPEYGVLVPLRNGDVICFNPLIFHCCSDALNKRCAIFSLYTTEKTFHAKISSGE